MLGFASSTSSRWTLALLVGLLGCAGQSGEDARQTARDPDGGPGSPGRAEHDDDDGPRNDDDEGAADAGAPEPDVSPGPSPGMSPAPTNPATAPGTNVPPTVTTIVPPPSTTMQPVGTGGVAVFPGGAAGAGPTFGGAGGRPVTGGTGGIGGAPFPVAGAGGWDPAPGGAGGQSQVPNVDVPLPEGCSASSRPGFTSWCSLEVECTEGVRTSYCSQFDDRWVCSCEAGSGYVDLEFEGVDASTACVEAVEVCPNLEEIPLTDEGCELSTAFASATSCTLENVCTKRADLGDGLTLTLPEYPRASCNENVDEWSCGCDVGNTWVGFPATGDDALAVCSSVMATCSENELERLGPMQCSTNSQNAYSNWCQSTSNCTQPGAFAGMDVELSGRLSTYCELADDGGWTCQCDAGGAALSFEGEGADPFVTCTQANTRCAAELELESRGYDYGGAGGTGSAGIRGF